MAERKDPDFLRAKPSAWWMSARVVFDGLEFGKSTPVHLPHNERI